MRLWLYEFEIEALNSLHLAAFSGPSFRGGFGSLLRKLTCVTGMPDCEDCPVRSECPFTRLFNAQAPKDDQHFVNQSQVPRPFILETPELREVSHGQHLRFRVGLVGESNKDLAYLVLAFRQLGIVGLGKGRGKYKLIQVTSIDSLGAGLPRHVFDGSENRLSPCNTYSMSLEDVEKHCTDVKPSALVVRFISPTHLKSIGRAPQEPPEFEHILRAVLRRYSDLAALYSEGRPQLNYKELVDKSKVVKTSNSQLKFFRQLGFSTRKGEYTPTEGLVGSIRFEGDFSPFLPYLIFGQWLHIGKQATFGMGAYQVEAAA